MGPGDMQQHVFSIGKQQIPLITSVYTYDTRDDLVIFEQQLPNGANKTAAFKPALPQGTKTEVSTNKTVQSQAPDSVIEMGGPIEYIYRNTVQFIQVYVYHHVFVAFCILCANRTVFIHQCSRFHPLALTTKRRSRTLVLWRGTGVW